jgi:membrane-bound lytic murein transglycosylase B
LGTTRRTFLSLATLGVTLPLAAPLAAATSRHGPRKGKPARKQERDDAGYAGRDEVRAFVDEMVAEHGFSRTGLLRAFAAARFQPRILAAMDRPLVAPPKWFEYAPNFLNDERIAAGAQYWRAHAAALARAEAEYGVPPGVVVGILGVETHYGRNVGSYRVLDALATLAFDYPRRAAFFRGELAQFLLFARDERLSPLVPVGSFAGAMGVPQFMPGSVRRYAVDFDGDGRIDLWRSDDDAIGSVANYLARHDWMRGQPVLLPALVDAAQRPAVLRRLDGGISERRSLAAWSEDGVSAFDAPADLAPDPVGLLLLEESGADEDASLWIACPNFYVITRYNKSRLYAAAVWSLGEAVRRSSADRATSTSARVDASVPSGSGAPSRSAATSGLASDLPSSTPHWSNELMP